MRMTRVLGAVATAALSSALLVGCGEKEEAARGNSSSDDVAAAALTKENFGSTIGDAMIASGSAHLSMSGTIMGQELAAEGDHKIGKTLADHQLGLTMQVLGMDVEMRLFDEVVYVNLGPLTQSMFATIDLNDSSNPLVEQFGGMVDQADIAAQLENVKSAISGFEKAGEPETIDAVIAQPYTVTLDPTKLAEGQERIPKSLKSTFYVGPDNLPRRLLIEVQGQTLTLDLSKWGESVSIEKPADDEITEFDVGRVATAA
ncbi:MAG: hypothetical protein WBQ48_02465 [Aeromicrobium sp.]